MTEKLLPFRRRTPLRAAEFFAGVGLARMGLERAGFKVTWANDIEKFKYEMYEGNFGGDCADHTFRLADVADITGAEIPDIDLAWASFPCTDLSLAGSRAGLAGSSSSTFFQFTRILSEMGTRRPPVVAIENVTALASSHGGEDLAAAIRELNQLGYSADVLSLDARRWVPQSRQRLFIVGAQHPPTDSPTPGSVLRPDWLQSVYGDTTLTTHRASLPEPPAPLTSGLNQQIEQMPDDDIRWWNEARKVKFLNSMSPLQTQRLDSLIKSSEVSYRTAYRRTRNKQPVWEMRADNIAGCLRTARGGSSKQAVVKAGRGSVQIRWMTPLEYARLMGAGDYKLGNLRDSQILFGFGDAVCVDTVSWVAENYLSPLIKRGFDQTHRAKRNVSNG